MDRPSKAYPNASCNVSRSGPQGSLLVMPEGASRLECHEAGASRYNFRRLAAGALLAGRSVAECELRWTSLQQPSSSCRIMRCIAMC